MDPETAPVMAAAGVALVCPPPQGPFEGADDGAFPLVSGVQEMADLGDAERDQVPGLARPEDGRERFCGFHVLF